ncbi:hypothetical protein ABH17_009845 [Bacillus toyonensis]|nr:hypothetical protein F8507_18600 [Bacillus toyonensis]QEQ19616.1 hypothetical protein F0362_24275 [Bacillus sp. BS98]MBE7137598.1 hypothetical protein [Bacillus toyonensis]MBE7165921.1 hypothetical protein [Bacillus toyonensis]MDO8156883.1 hypothetical protein [Bacillus toyonensis]
MDAPFVYQLGWNRGQTLVPRQICLGMSVFLCFSKHILLISQVPEHVIANTLTFKRRILLCIQWNKL